MKSMSEFHTELMDMNVVIHKTMGIHVDVHRSEK